jgi:oligoendopeptidase F
MHFFQNIKIKNHIFKKKYINLLKAGGSKNYIELLKPFNLDITKKNFWTQSISVVNDLIDELESII